MGDIARILAAKTSFSAPLFNDKLRLEAAEAMHIHWRDLRILATVSQFETVGDAFYKAFKKWDGSLSEDEDVNLSYPVLPDGILFDTICSIEEQESGIIHFHYGDIRLELKSEIFLFLARLFEQAKKKYNNSRVDMMPLDSIDPYDLGHFPTEREWLEYDREHSDRSDDYYYHEDGIRKVISGIIFGKKIRPITVQERAQKYKRTDGFKRYMAYKRLRDWGDPRRNLIPCYVVDHNVPAGVQDGQPWFLE